MTTSSLLGIAAFIIGTLTVATFLLAFPRGKRLVLGLLAFTACYVRKPFYSEILYHDYRILDHGFGVRLADLFFFGLLLALLVQTPWRALVWLPYNILPWAALIGLGLVSTLLSPEPLLGAFTLHKMVRAALLYWVVVNTVRDAADLRAVLAGLTASLYLEFLLVFKDKYVTGDVVYRSLGSFRHPNTLAMYTNLLAPLLLAVLLSGSLPGRWTPFLAGGLVMALVCVLFTRSRAGIVLHLLALAGAAGLSLLQHTTGRKLRILALAAAALLLAAPLALPRVIERFQRAPAESLEVRRYLNSAARAMASDHPFGVGLNQFYPALNQPRYYGRVYPEAAQMADPQAFQASPAGRTRLGIVHNIYLLHAAEIGWAGLSVFILFLARFLILNIRKLRRAGRGSLEQAVCQGILCGTVAIHVQGTLEFVLGQTELLFTYFILTGLIVAVGRQAATARRSESPARQLVGVSA